MQIGASTSNLYPALTEVALERLLAMEFRRIEVFLNTVSEATPAFARALRDRADAAGATIVSVHPYLSLAEPYCLFSLYERRFEDGFQEYRALAEAAAILGARYLILHGDRSAAPPLSPKKIRHTLRRSLRDGRNVWRYPVAGECGAFSRGIAGFCAADEGPAGRTGAVYAGL